MRYLRNDLLLLSLCFEVVACQSTAGFNLKTFNEGKNKYADDLHVIEVASNRIQQKCLFYDAEAENNWRHQNFMYLLNDEGETLELMHPFEQDYEYCQLYLRKIEKILKSEPQVKICARGDLRRKKRTGVLNDNKVDYDFLTLDTICSSSECVSYNDVWVNTCPGFVKNTPPR